MFVFATTFKLLELGYVQGEQIGPNVAIFWLLFTGIGKFWVRIWFVVSTYRAQKGGNVDVFDFKIELFMNILLQFFAWATVWATFPKIWANFLPIFWSP
jgi:hypothetical protein